MTFEEYKAELEARMKAFSWQEKENIMARLESPAHDLMVQASNDRDGLSLDEFEKLSHIFYGW